MESDKLMKQHKRKLLKFMKIFKSNKIAPGLATNEPSSHNSRKQNNVDECVKKTTAHSSRTEHSEATQSRSNNPPHIQSTPYCHVNEEALRMLNIFDPQTPAAAAALEDLSLAAIECKQAPNY